MGKCSNCGKKIMYNRYKMYREKVLCLECYATRLKRKAAKKAELKRLAKLNEIVEPTKKAKKATKQTGLAINTLHNVVEDETAKTAEDSR